MTKQIIKNWEPAKALPEKIDLTIIHCDFNLVATLSSDGFVKNDTSIVIELKFNKPLAFRVVENEGTMHAHDWTYEADRGTVVTIVENSQYIQWLLDQGGIMYEDRFKNANHYLIGINELLLEVVSDEEPEIKIVKN